MTVQAEKTPVHGMKLVLVNLYPTETLAKYLYSSYVLKAYLEENLAVPHPLDIKVVNFPADKPVAFLKRVILESGATVVGYSCYIWNIEKILQVIQSLKSHPLIQILGGPEISHHRVAGFPDPGAADYYVVGPGERPLTAIMDRLAGNPEAAFPAGVFTWTGRSFTGSPGPAPPPRPDEVPSVYLTGAMEERLYGRQQAFLETQRGCRFKCSYCVYHKDLSRLAYFPLERILAELDHLITGKKIRALRLLDAIFPSDLARAKTIVRHLGALKECRQGRLPWIFWEFTYHSVDEEFLTLVGRLKKRHPIANHLEIPPLDRPQMYSELLRGYTVVNAVGLQSFHPQALKSVHRAPVSWGQLSGFLETVRRLNLVLKLDIILGLPFETPESFWQGLDRLLPWLQGTDHILNIHRLQVLPGSELETRATALGLRYSQTAPHGVWATPSFPPSLLARTLKLCALLFRILNSPLRQAFFDAWDPAAGRLRGFLEQLLDEVQSSSGLRQTRIVRDEWVDDNYWSGKIFREIPSDWLAGTLSTPGRMVPRHD